MPKRSGREVRFPDLLVEAQIEGDMGVLRVQSGQLRHDRLELQAEDIDELSATVDRIMQRDLERCRRIGLAPRKHLMRKSCAQCKTEFVERVRKPGKERIYCCDSCKTSAYRERKKSAESR